MRKKPVNPGGLFHVHRTVSDMKASIDFYVTVLGYYYDHGTTEMAWLRKPGLLLTLSPGETVLDLGSYLGWTVEDADELSKIYAELERRRLRLSAPPDQENNQHYFFLYDPDDYPIAFSVQQFEE